MSLCMVWGYLCFLFPTPVILWGRHSSGLVCLANRDPDDLFTILPNATKCHQNVCMQQNWSHMVKLGARIGNSDLTMTESERFNVTGRREAIFWRDLEWWCICPKCWGTSSATRTCVAWGTGGRCMAERQVSVLQAAGASSAVGASDSRAGDWVQWRARWEVLVEHSPARAATRSSEANQRGGTFQPRRWPIRGQAALSDSAVLPRAS